MLLKTLILWKLLLVTILHTLLKQNLTSLHSLLVLSRCCFSAYLLGVQESKVYPLPANTHQSVIVTQPDVSSSTSRQRLELQLKNIQEV